MDGVSKDMQASGAQAIYRPRETVLKGGDTQYEIREKSERGEWVLYGAYPTKENRATAWLELAKDETNVMEWFGPENPQEAAQGAVTPVPSGAQDARIWQMEEQHKYEVYAVEMAAKVQGAAMRESMERLLKAMFLRQTKEQLKADGKWSKWCADHDIDVKHADYEIEKLPDWKDEVLLKFGAHTRYDINKIKYLTNGNSEKLGVTVENGQVMVKGEPIPLTPEDVGHVVATLQEEAQKREEKAEADRTKEEKAHGETKKALKKAEGELKKIRREAARKGMTAEEEGFLRELEGMRTEFDKLFSTLSAEDIVIFAQDDQVGTPRVITAYGTMLDYMSAQIDHARAATAKLQGGK